MRASASLCEWRRILGRGRTARPVFDSFPWWDEGDVLTQITPARFAYVEHTLKGGLAGSRVLDLGCGGGLLAEPLTRAGAKVTGIDVSAPAIRTAHAHAARGGLTIDYAQAPAEMLPLAPATFDAVVAFDSLEHVDDLDRTIGEVARVLKPGGHFVYDTMNRTLLCRLVAIWIGENLWPGGPPKGTHDWRKFIKPGEMTALARKHGITNLEMRGFVPVPRNLRLHMGMRLAPYKGLSYVGVGVKGF